MNIINKIVDTLISQRDKKSSTKVASIKQEHISELLPVIQNVFAEESMLLKLSPPLTICGDTHGQFYDLLRLFEEDGYPPDTRYLFLGDYVDRGKYSIEVVCLLFALKLKFPNHIFLLRGNHEDASLNRVYGFYDECKRKYNVKTWKSFVDCFNYMPIAALVENKILCMHGGISPQLTDLNMINQIYRPQKIPDDGIMCDLLWADPEKDISGWQENDRGVSYIFGADTVKEFVEKHKLDLICRAHQVVEDGYEFFADKKLITVFSAPNYDNSFTNSAGMLKVDNNLLCSIKVLKPKLH